MHQPYIGQLHAKDPKIRPKPWVLSPSNLHVVFRRPCPLFRGCGPPRATLLQLMLVSCSFQKGAIKRVGGGRCQSSSPDFGIWHPQTKLQHPTASIWTPQVCSMMALCFWGAGRRHCSPDTLAPEATSTVAPSANSRPNTSRTGDASVFHEVWFQTIA